MHIASLSSHGTATKPGLVRTALCAPATSTRMASPWSSRTHQLTECAPCTIQTPILHWGGGRHEKHRRTQPARWPLERLNHDNTHTDAEEEAHNHRARNTAACCTLLHTADTCRPHSPRPTHTPCAGCHSIRVARTQGVWMAGWTSGGGGAGTLLVGVLLVTGGRPALVLLAPGHGPVLGQNGQHTQRNAACQHGNGCGVG